MSALPAAFCFHCHEPLQGSRLTIDIDGRREPVCCIGCQAVAEMIASCGLKEFYQRRTAPSPRPQDTGMASDEWSAYGQPELAAEFVRVTATGKSVDLIIENVRCSACGWLIEQTLQAIPGITSIDVNASLGRAHIEWTNGDSTLERVLRAIARLGYRPHPLNEHTVASVCVNERRTMLKRFIVATFGMMQVMMFAIAGYSASLNHETIDPALDHYFRLISLFVSVPVVFYAARPFLANALNGLRARTIGMDLPVSVALLLAFIASAWNTLTRQGEVYFDSITMFVFFLTLSRLIELTVRHRTNSVADALARHLPATAIRVRDGRNEVVATSQLRPGDQVLVPTGATVPADGVVRDGTAEINESLLTGESLPVLRRVGECAASGSINVGAPIRIEIAAIGANTVLSSIVALLRRAQTQKPATALQADRAAASFLRAVLIMSVCVCAAWLVFDPSRAFAATLAVLVVACPCAFSIAAPTALAAASAHLARNGVLVTRPDALEALAQVQHVVFDKTGTLTRGEIQLEAHFRSGWRTQAECLAIAAALEQASDHPIARAFRNISVTHLPAASTKSVPGLGIEGSIDGEIYRIGTVAFVGGLRGQAAWRAAAPAHPCARTIRAPCPAGELIAGSVIALGDQREELARFVLSDSLRDDSPHAVGGLERLGITSELLSGDAPQAVASLARRCRIPTFEARYSPEQKLARLRELQSQGKIVAMLGDGINDAPVLGGADVSIAMGRGAALALASADLVLVSERPSALPFLITTARKAARIARQNLVWSAAYNFCALPLAAFGMISPWVAAIGMSLSSLLVLANALRLLPRRAAPDHAMPPLSGEPAPTSA